MPADRVAQDGEETVHRRWIGQFELLMVANRVVQTPRCGVRPRSEGEQEIVLENGEVLGRDEPHLAVQLRDVLAQVLGASSEGAVQPHDRLAEHQAGLGRPERHDVDAGSDRERTKCIPRATECGRGVGDSRTVEVDEHAVCMRNVANVTNLRRRVERAEFGRLREGDDGRLYVVHCTAQCGEAHDVVGAQLRIDRGNSVQFGTEEALGCARFVDVDVRPLRAHDRFRGGEHRHEGEHVGSGSAVHEQRVDVGAEQLRHRRGCTARPRVLAVGECVARIRGSNGFDDPRMGSGDVVRRERRRRCNGE